MARSPDDKNKKGRAIFVDLTTAYDTAIAYKLGLNCKLVRFLLYRIIRCLNDCGTYSEQTLHFYNGERKQNRKEVNWLQASGRSL